MIRAILTDIEGTTTSIEFVHRTLFPYARARIRSYLAEHAETPAVRAQIDAVAKLEGRPLSVHEAADILERWIDEDRKLTPLKALQGLIWAEGYAAGVLKGHVYPDTPLALRAWHTRGIALYVYSSGSVEAQKLIFGHTDYGDLTALLSGYFDTTIGPKREAQSYRRIRDAIGLPANEILFLSDVAEELDAAREAGMATCQLLRDAQVHGAPSHPQAEDLSQVSV